MKTISRTHYALSVCAAAAILAGCGGGSASPSYQLPNSSQSTRAQSVSSAVAVHDASCQGRRSFQYIAHTQLFTVPKCTRSIFIDAFGAEGAHNGGDGGEVSATIPVTPHAKLIITVGGAGSRWQGGFNGGGAGAQQQRVKPGGGGGGATDVRQGGNTLAGRVVVAGGGGGQDIGGDPGAGGTGGGLPDGGSGGIPVCSSIKAIGGGGGTQSSGGAGGAGSNGGSLGDGGTGVGGCVFSISHMIFMSSGGGGGHYGGGGGAWGGAGGGGSGYAEPAATNVSSQNGVNSGNGTVLICWGYSNGECGSRQRL
jgi:hypothetical protein